MNQDGTAERRSAKARLLGERKMLAAALEDLEEGVIACDGDGVLTLFNSAALRFHGLNRLPLTAEQWAPHHDLYLPDETTPLAAHEAPLLRALAGEVVADTELVIAPRNGGRRVVEVNGHPVFGDDGEKLGAVVTMQDITERKQAARELARKAFEDPLTGLGNRAGLAGRLERARRRAVDTGSTLAVLIIDLDDFKRINDSLDHGAGDLLLVEVARRLRAFLDDPHFAARLGGDEFAVVLEDTTEEMAVGIAQRILEAAAVPFVLDGSDVTVGASIGIALSEAGKDDGDQLLRAADLAMYASKGRGKGRHVVFEPGMHLAALGRLALESDLRRALAAGEFSLAYQPVVSPSTGAMVGVEALLRWHPPGQSPLGPDDFIPVAEETGLIVPIGAWVLEEACAQARRWDEEYPDRERLTMAVNVSGRQLQCPGLIDTLVDVLARSGLEPRRLVLEITESTLMGDDEVAMATLWEIERLGAKLSIDDFGTGYSSLSRLRTLPVAGLKIDRSFVNEINGPDAEAPLVVAALAMARGVGLSVVAEGIETNDQVAFLREHGCPEAQGFLLGRPVEPATITAMLRRGEPLVDVERQPAAAGIGVDNELMAVVEAMVTSHDEPGDHDDAIRSLLNELGRITGLESTYLTEIHWERLEQEIRYARNTGRLDIPEGLVVEWADTLCRRALLGGPCNTDDVPVAYPDSEAAQQLGLQTYVSVPVPAPDGQVFGTLCGASSRRLSLSEPDMAVVHLFARLVADKLAKVTMVTGGSAV